ncbi:MAG: hypothetical protein ABJF11_18990 [Reichenbachiella sp.]|uniref:hypothetical protein n=1 Tax=Reichenbachiella sp. TaxID=2184521 RepID=UPI003264721D
MISLHITSRLSAETLWIDQLKEWCVAHEVIQNESLQVPELHEGGKKMVGTREIEDFLKEYRTFMDDWYDCRCDKWQEV